MTTEDEIFAIEYYTSKAREIRRELAKLEDRLSRMESNAARWGYQWQDGKFVKQAPPTAPGGSGGEE